jgi:hypothetical protein
MIIIPLPKVLGFSFAGIRHLYPILTGILEQGEQFLSDL